MSGDLHPSVFRVLVVCTGNICRSPMAESLFRDGLRRRVGEDHRWVDVRSAGTHATDGRPIERDAQHALAALGVDGTDRFRARALTGSMVEQADLVLAAAREHRAAAVRLVPSAAHRTFTLRELDRLVRALDPAAVAPGTPRERGTALVEAAAGMRGRTDFVPPEEDDVADPYRRPVDAFERAAADIARALQRPLDLLTGVRP